MVENSIKVSWLLPTNNIDGGLEDSISSIFGCHKHTDCTFEILIVINGKAIDAYKRNNPIWLQRKELRIIVSNLNGITPALNKGLCEANGEYIARLDCDDICHPKRLARQLDILDKHEEVCAVFTNKTNKKALLNTNLHNKKFYIVNDRHVLAKNILIHPSVTYKRDIVRFCGGYAGGKHAEDIDLWLRLLSENNTLVILDEELIYYEPHSRGSARNNIEGYIGHATSLLAFGLRQKNIKAIMFSIARAILILIRPSKKKK